jgi:hypothetical protein
VQSQPSKLVIRRAIPCAITCSATGHQLLHLCSLKLLTTYTANDSAHPDLPNHFCPELVTLAFLAWADIYQGEPTVSWA